MDLGPPEVRHNTQSHTINRRDCHSLIPTVTVSFPDCHSLIPRLSLSHQTPITCALAMCGCRSRLSSATSCRIWRNSCSSRDTLCLEGPERNLSWSIFNKPHFFTGPMRRGERRGGGEKENRDEGGEGEKEG